MNRPRLLALLAVLVAALAVVPAAAAAPKLQAGVGRADITPPTGYYMMGWVRSDAKIQGVNTRLWARVIVLRQGGRKLALVSEDLNGIPGGMLKQAADMNRDIGFSQQNVLDSASHTHAAPSGFYNFPTYNTVFMTITTPTDFALAGSIDQQLYAFMVRRLALAIRRANADLGPAAAGWGEVNIDHLTQNRSLEAHLYDHGIHLGYGKGKPSMDPDGRLHTIDRQGNVLRVDRVRGRRRFPIGIWSTFANHGTVNRFQFNFYNEDHHGAATRGVERALRRRGHVPRGQDVVAAYGNSDEGDMSSGLTRMGPAAADYVGSVEARAFLRAWRAAGRHMQRRPRLSWRWTRMCFCGQVTSAGQVADKGSFGLAEFTGSEEGRGPLFDITHTPFEGQHLPAGAGPQGDKEQTAIPANVPAAVPLMAVRIGNRVIASVPGEMTVDMGRRVRAAVLKAAGGSGVVRTIISGLANEYTSYFTTPQEYDAQHYEGAATVYGRASSVAIEDALVALTKTLVAGKAAPKPYPYDPTQGVSPAGQPFSKGASRGHDLTNPATPVARLGHAEFAWYGGERGFDRPLDRAFVRIQRRVKKRHWRTIDTDLGLRTVWKVDGSGRYTVRWEVPLGARLGRYRFVVTANRYRLVSRVFWVRTSRELSAVRVAAPAGRAAIRLAYPRPRVDEDVNRPAGDFHADLMARPRFASRGRATVVVNGRRRHVRARRGVFTFPAAPGAKVRVPDNAVRDRYGNANGRALAFTR